MSDLQDELDSYEEQLAHRDREGEKASAPDALFGGNLVVEHKTGRVPWRVALRQAATYEALCLPPVDDAGSTSGLLPG